MRRNGYIAIEGAQIHHELRGGGPPLLMVMGATGDGGHFDALAELLADRYTVITYDRRGCGRSSAPAGWDTTSPEEQADDAAAVLRALAIERAAVFGTSSGATFALALSVRHPDLVFAVVLHEPALYALVDDFDVVRAPVRELIASALEDGGPRLAAARFWDHVAGSGSWDSLEPALRERIERSAGTLLDVELGSYELYLPGEELLARVAPRTAIVVGDRTSALYRRLARLLAERIGGRVASTPGGHAAYHDDPVGLARVVSAKLRELEAGSPSR